jgi:hypothetical protein
MEQYQIWIFWLLLAVKTELTSLSKISCQRCYCWIDCWIEHSYLLRCFLNQCIYSYSHNLPSQPRCDGSLFGVYVSKQDLWAKSTFWQFPSPFELRSRIVTPVGQNPHLWRNLVGSWPRNLSCRPLVWNLADLSPRASLSKVVAGIAPFCQPWVRVNVSIATLTVNMIVRCYRSLLMASPRSLPPWSLSCTSFIVFAFCISRLVGYQVAPCLWRQPLLF